MRTEDRVPLGGGLRREDRGEVGARLGLGGGVADDLGDIGLAADRRVQRDPELGLERADGEIAMVGGLVDAVASEATVERLDAARGRRAAVHVAELGSEECERAFGHRDVEVRAFVRASATDERAEDGGRAPQCAAREVCDLDAGHPRRAVGGAAHREHAGECEVAEIVASAFGVRAGLAETADRADDDARVACGERLVREAELGHHAGAEALDDDVGFLDHREERVASRGRFEIERDRSLAAIDGEEATAHSALGRWERADVIAEARVLDLDDVRAHVGEDHREKWPRQEPREIEDSDAGERVGQR